jgi:DNA-directed RNA polymerase specialized sigma subunit
MLTWEEVQTQFENLVKFAAKNTYMGRISVDSSVSVEDLYQIGMMKLYDCWDRYKHLPMDEFKQVFSTTLFRAVRRGARPSMTMDIDSVEHEPIVLEDFTDTLGTSEGVEELKSMLNSPVALAILQELIEPSPRTIWEVWADRARKEKVKMQGKNVNVPKTNEVRMKHIRQALRITQKQFDLGIAEIRAKASIAFGLA